MKKILIILLISNFLMIINSSCRNEKEIFDPDVENLDTVTSEISGLYLLNEGNMGSNKATLDFYDFETGEYFRNIYAAKNPTVPKELGDVGNNLAIYGSKLYAVINCSNKIEVMDAKTAERIGQIDIPNCRYIDFHNGFAYVTSYAGPIEINPSYQQRGYVAKIDTASLTVIAECLVGFQPEDLEIANNKIYVANSGGYMFPNYENTLSVIDLTTFSEIKKIEIAINLHRLCKDKYGNIWVNSRGNYNASFDETKNTDSRLYCIDSKGDTVIDSVEIAVSNFYLDEDNLYICGAEWDYQAMQNRTNYGIIDVRTRKIITKKFITDGRENSIQIPYGIVVNPINKDIYITDAKNYVTPGTLYCFDSKGKQKWNIRTGDIPGHFCFLYKNL